MAPGVVFYILPTTVPKKTIFKTFCFYSQNNVQYTHRFNITPSEVKIYQLPTYWKIQVTGRSRANEW